MKLFLDDLRDPPDDTWTIARSFSEAVALIEEHGIPGTISFDHDLGDDKTGLDFAHYLIDLDLEKHLLLDNFTYQVHSANPVGRDNIVGLMERYLRFRCDGA